MITIDKLLLRYGSKTIFQNVCATINKEDKIALVGSNGAGKSTLLKMIKHLDSPESGKIHIPKEAIIGYLPQEGIISEGIELYEDVERIFGDIKSWQRQLSEKNDELDALDTESPRYIELLNEIGELEHTLQENEVHKLRAKIEKILFGLGFKKEDMTRDTGEFSGGWQMRIALAKLLLTSPDILLLDEPTNHLDITSQRWLEKYLKNYDGALMLISHDSSFLDLLCKKTFALSKGKLEIYAGNYSYYEKEKVIRRAQLVREYEEQQKMIKTTQEFIDRFRYKASKAKQAQSRIKALEKVERIEIDAEESEIHFEFPTCPKSGEKVLEIEGLSKSYDQLSVLNAIDLVISKGDKIGIVGNNGSGKSTLLKILAGVESFQGGEREEGFNTKLSYFSQHQSESLDPSKELLETLEQSATTKNQTQLRNILGTFLFEKDDAFKKVKVLSGGEKSRLSMACMLSQPANFILMDEPTNHIDVRTRKVLQSAIKDFPGTYVIVSHDRSFLDPLITKVIEVKDEKINIYLGNITDYLSQTEGNEPDAPSIGKGKTVSKHDNLSPKERRKQKAEKSAHLTPLKKKIKQFESSISKWDEEKSLLETEMADPDFFNKGAETTDKMKQHDTLQRNIDAAYADWEKVEQSIKKLEH